MLKQPATVSQYCTVEGFSQVPRAGLMDSYQAALGRLLHGEAKGLNKEKLNRTLQGGLIVQSIRLDHHKARALFVRVTDPLTRKKMWVFERVTEEHYKDVPYLNGKHIRASQMLVREKYAKAARQHQLVPYVATDFEDLGEEALYGGAYGLYHDGYQCFEVSDSQQEMLGIFRLGAEGRPVLFEGGPGTGKTTLLKMMQDADEDEAEARPAHQIVFMAQNPGLIAQIRANYESLFEPGNIPTTTRFQSCQQMLASEGGPLEAMRDESSFKRWFDAKKPFERRGTTAKLAYRESVRIHAHAVKSWIAKSEDTQVAFAETDCYPQTFEAYASLGARDSCIPSPERKAFFHSVYVAYLDYMTQADEEDLQLFRWKRMSAHLAAVQDSSPCVILDEMQDLGPAWILFLNALSRGKFQMAGNEAQALFMPGMSSINWARVMLPSLRVQNLNESYRLAQHPLHFANLLATVMYRYRGSMSKHESAGRIQMSEGCASRAGTVEMLTTLDGLVPEGHPLFCKTLIVVDKTKVAAGAIEGVRLAYSVVGFKGLEASRVTVSLQLSKEQLTAMRRLNDWLQVEAKKGEPLTIARLNETLMKPHLSKDRIEQSAQADISELLNNLWTAFTRGRDVLVIVWPASLVESCRHVYSLVQQMAEFCKNPEVQPEDIEAERTAAIRNIRALQEQGRHSEARQHYNVYLRTQDDTREIHNAVFGQFDTAAAAAPLQTPDPECSDNKAVPNKVIEVPKQNKNPGKSKNKKRKNKKSGPNKACQALSCKQETKSQTDKQRLSDLISTLPERFHPDISALSEKYGQAFVSGMWKAWGRKVKFPDDYSRSFFRLNLLLASTMVDPATGEVSDAIYGRNMFIVERNGLKMTGLASFLFGSDKALYELWTLLEDYSRKALEGILVVFTYAMMGDCSLGESFHIRLRKNPGLKKPYHIPTGSFPILQCRDRFSGAVMSMLYECMDFPPDTDEHLLRTVVTHDGSTQPLYVHLEANRYLYGFYGSMRIHEGYQEREERVLELDVALTGEQLLSTSSTYLKCGTLTLSSWHRLPLEVIDHFIENPKNFVKVVFLSQVSWKGAVAPFLMVLNQVYHVFDEERRSRTQRLIENINAERPTLGLEEMKKNFKCDAHVHLGDKASVFDPLIGAHASVSPEIEGYGSTLFSSLFALYVEMCRSTNSSGFHALEARALKEMFMSILPTDSDIQSFTPAECNRWGVELWDAMQHFPINYAPLEEVQNLLRSFIRYHPEAKIALRKDKTLVLQDVGSIIGKVGQMLNVSSEEAVFGEVFSFIRLFPQACHVLTMPARIERPSLEEVERRRLLYNFSVSTKQSRIFLLNEVLVLVGEADDRIISEQRRLQNAYFFKTSVAAALIENDGEDLFKSSSKETWLHCKGNSSAFLLMLLLHDANTQEDPVLSTEYRLRLTQFMKSNFFERALHKHLRTTILFGASFCMQVQNKEKYSSLFSMLAFGSEFDFSLLMRLLDSPKYFDHNKGAHFIGSLSLRHMLAQHVSPGWRKPARLLEAFFGEPNRIFALMKYASLIGMQEVKALMRYHILSGFPLVSAAENPVEAATPKSVEGAGGLKWTSSKEKEVGDIIRKGLGLSPAYVGVAFMMGDSPPAKINEILDATLSSLMPGKCIDIKSLSILVMPAELRSNTCPLEVLLLYSGAAETLGNYICTKSAEKQKTYITFFTELAALSIRLSHESVNGDEKGKVYTDIYTCENEHLPFLRRCRPLAEEILGVIQANARKQHVVQPKVQVFSTPKNLSGIMKIVPVDTDVASAKDAVDVCPVTPAYKTVEAMARFSPPSSKEERPVGTQGENTTPSFTRKAKI